MTEPYRTDIQVRFNDTDALGHLNNTAYALYAEQARVTFFQGLDTPTRSLILAHLSLDFRAQVRYGDRVYVLTRVAKLGNSSVTLKQDIYANDTLVAETRSVVVVFDYTTQQPLRIPEAMRGALERVLVG